MSFFENFYITDVTHAFETNFERSESSIITCRETFGICFVKSGSVIFYCDDKSYLCNKTQAVILPKGASYSWKCNNDCCVFMINFSCLNKLDSKDFSEIPLRNPDIYFNDLHILEKYYSKRKVIGNAQYLSVLYKIIAMLCKENHIEPCLQIKGADEFINNHFFDSNLNNHILAKHFNLSVSHFRNLFKKTYNTSPMNYVHNLRIEKAKQLLLYSNFTITEISEKCGFSNLYSFSRAFKSSVGISPNNYTKFNKINII